MLTQGTKVLQEAGAARIVSDSDTVNVPMARAFERAGYRRFLTRVAYAIELAPTSSCFGMTGPGTPIK